MSCNHRYRPHLLGQKAENVACEYLRGQGLKLATRNFHCRQGEIDLIMHQGDTLVFIEVRYRTSEDYGGALASVDRRKQRRIIRCAECYLVQHPQELQRAMRLDVICVHLDQATPHCDWIQNAFEAF